MNIKEFKKLVDQVAEANQFIKAFGGWFKESSECIAILELQKSGFGNYYYLNIKIFIQDIFGKKYSPSKELMKSAIGHINGHETQLINNILDFDKLIDDEKRFAVLQEMFDNIIIPFTNKALTRNGIIELATQNKIFLLPAVKQQLGL